MAIILTPSGPVQAVIGTPVCFEASATNNYPSEDERCIDLASSGTNWVYAACVWQKLGGVNYDTDADAIVTAPIHRLQPFSISASINTFDVPASPDRNYATYLGILANGEEANCGGNQCFFGWIPSKYCNSTGSGTCNVNNGSSLATKWFVCIAGYGGIIQQWFNVTSPGDTFRLRSDGINFYWDHRRSGVWVNAIYQMPVPANATTYNFYLNALFNNNRLHNVLTSKGTFQGQVPVTWTAPLGGTLTIEGTGANQCFVHTTPGTFQICAETEFDAPVCADIELAALYFRPVDRDCGDCVYVNETITFESNGEQNGVLTATAGTVIDNLTWQAPSFTVPEGVTLTYTLNTAFVQCTLTVIDELQVTNVEGDTITGLVPGDTFQIEVNYPYIVEWENVTCQNIVSPTGLITIPPNINPYCFGATDCIIKGRVTDMTDHVCDNIFEPGNPTGNNLYIELRIIVEPVYPTPEFGGPKFRKWKPEVPEYNVITNTSEGGCRETYLRNRVAVYKWTVDYEGLSSAFECPPEECCDTEQGFIGGFSPSSSTVQVLDDFWNYVYGTYGQFTMKDPRTGVTWRNVRFETTMQKDHINWRTQQSRTVTLIWTPCCDAEPAGGQCPHVSSIIDITPPGSPQNVQTEALSSHTIRVTWQRALDNVGVKGYEIWINGAIIDIGHHLGYNHTGLEDLSTHEYKVRAYDFAGNRSIWSELVLGTTLDIVVDGGDDVLEGGDEVIEG